MALTMFYGAPGSTAWPSASAITTSTPPASRTWPIRRDLETGDGYCLTNNSRDGLNREFSYPSIRQSADGELHVAFTYHRRVIKYVRLRPDWASR